MIKEFILWVNLKYLKKNKNMNNKNPLAQITN